MIRPPQPAATVPFSWLPVAFQTADSTSRPPSSGSPGSTLKMPISRLAQTKMLARIPATPVRSPGGQQEPAAGGQHEVGQRARHRDQHGAPG